jgi:hypothetical protein
MTFMPHERKPIAQENRQASPIVHSFEQGQWKNLIMSGLRMRNVPLWRCWRRLSAKPATGAIFAGGRDAANC